MCYSILLFLQKPFRILLEPSRVLTSGPWCLKSSGIPHKRFRKGGGQLASNDNTIRKKNKVSTHITHTVDHLGSCLVCLHALDGLHVTCSKYRVIRRSLTVLSDGIQKRGRG